MRSASAFAIALVSCAGSAWAASGLNVRPGAWEITTTVVMTGVPVPAEALASMSPEQRARIEARMRARSGQPKVRVTKSCLTRQEAEQNRILAIDDDEEGCSVNVLSQSSTRIAYEKVCKGPPGSTAKVSIDAPTPQAVSAQMQRVTVGGDGAVSLDMKGRWLDSDCSGIKDRD